MEDAMKLLNLVLILCVLAAFPLAAGGGRQGPSGPAANSASVITAPGQVPLVNQPITLTFGFSQSPQVIDYETNYLTKFLNEKTGINHKFQLFAPGATDSRTQFELMVSSNERLPDMMNFAPANWITYGENGVFIELNNYFDKWAHFHNIRMVEDGISQADRDFIMMRTIAPNGKIYGIPQVSTQGINTFYGMNFINYKWLDKLGLQMPSTTEDFFNVMTAFRDRDPNGNGQRDELPWLGNLTLWSAQPIHFIMNAFLYYPFDNLNEMNLNVTNGKIWTPWTTEEFRDGLRFLRRLYDAGIFPATMFTMTQQELQAILSYQPGEVNRVGMLSAGPTVTFMPETPGVYDYTIQKALTGPKGVNFYPQIPPIAVAISSFITKDCRYPEAAFRWLDYRQDKDTSLIIRFGEKDVDWRYVRADENLMDESGLRPAAFTEINSIWTQPQNKHWANTNGAFWHLGAGFRTNQLGGWTGDRWALFQNVPINDGKDATEKVVYIAYSMQEEENIRALRTEINTYRNEAMALFITGALDIEREWNSYLQTLDRIGLQRYLQTAQTAYTRTVGR